MVSPISVIDDISSIAGILSGAPVSLGSDFQFNSYEVPETISFGGKQKTVLHVRPGGQRQIDAMGSENSAITWSGQFIGPGSGARAGQLDSLRQAGLAHDLIWGAFQFRVIIESCEFEYKRSYWVTYKISCTVLTPAPPSPPTSLATGAVGDCSIARGIGLPGALGSLGGLAGSLGGLAGSMGGMLGSLSGVMGGLGGNLSGALGALGSISGVGASLSGVLGSVGVIGGPISGLLGGNFVGPLGALGAGITATLGTIGNSFTGALGSVGAQLGGVINSVAPQMTGYLGTIGLGTISTALAPITSLVGSVTSLVGGSAAAVQVLSAVNNAQTVCSGVGNLVDANLSGLNSLASTFSSATPAAGMVNALGCLRDAVNTSPIVAQTSNLLGRMSTNLSNVTAG